jgi:hypothetical protein
MMDPAGSKRVANLYNVMNNNTVVYKPAAKK